MEGVSYRFDGFELDTAQYELRSGGTRIPIEPRAFDLLRHLIEHRSRVVSKEELFDSLWGDRYVGEAALTTALRTARIAIGDSGKEQRLIRTVLRRGYQFVGNVTDTGTGFDADRAASIDMPARLIEPVGLAFVGRNDERTLIAETCKEVIASGQRQLVLMSGEAGIGKTTLCSLAAADAHSDGAVVLYGRCDEELSIPYQPWREVIADLEHRTPTVMAEHRDALAPLLEQTSNAHPDSDSARFALYSAVLDVLDAVSADGRLTMVVLDDLHWSDAETVALLRHFVQRALTTPVMVVATFRDSDVDASHPLTGLLAAAHREPGMTRVALDRLDDGELLSLMEAMAGHEMDHDGLALRDALQVETEGNPFFVTEILRHLVETGAIAQADGERWTTPTNVRAQGLPISVREVVSRRVERLGADTRAALDAASVIGREFELDLLAAVLDKDPVSSFERLTPALNSSLVVDAAAGRFEFAHAIVAHTLYEEMSPTARAFTHETIAGLLEQRRSAGLDERSSRIAHHWLRAIGPASESKAMEYAQQAGEEALAHLAPDEAVTWFSRALELIPTGDTTQRCDVLVGLGTAQRQAGDPEHRATLLQAGQLAIDLGDDDLLVRAALANNRGEVSEVGTVDNERIEILRAAITARPDGPDSAMLHAILSIEMPDGPGNECRDTAARALELARQAGDDRTTARVVRLAESSLLTPDTLEQREQWMREGLDAAERTNDPLLRGMLSMSHHELALQRGDRDAMDHERLIRDRFAKRSTEPFVRWTNEQTRVTHLFLDGDLEGAEAAAAVALDIGMATGQPEAFSGFAGQLFQIRRSQGRLAEVVDEFQQFASENSSVEVFRAGLALMWCELDRHDDARSVADGLDLSRGDAPQYWSTTLMLWAEVCHALGLAEPAEQIASVLADWSDQVASTGATTEGAIAHGLGRALATAGRADEAAVAYDTALAVNRRLRAPLFVARTQLAQAELIADADPERARSIATDARNDISGCDFARVDRRLAALLDRL